MNVLLFGGFLGSGKTSIILQAARYLVHTLAEEAATRSQDSEKPFLVIIENEVGSSGIDDKVLKDEGFNVRELFAGCICCTLNAELSMCLSEIQEELSPQWVIIETTGMAFPDRIAESIRKYGEEIESLKTIVVADAERWEKLIMALPNLINEQIVNAEIILLNKIDNVKSEQVNKVEKNIRELNSSALFYPVSAHQAIDPQIWRKVVWGK